MYSIITTVMYHVVTDNSTHYSIAQCVHVFVHVSEKLCKTSVLSLIEHALR